MSETYRVRVTKDYLVFSAAHFITFNGNVCERLHGHNYRLEAEVAGPLDENHYVVDFIALHDVLRSIVAEMDHRVLLPTEHPKIKVTADAREVLATFEDRRWIFPREDCLLLPVANTTAELLARHIGHEMLARLKARSGFLPQSARVGVDECNGQWGIWELHPD